jgi:hypothetical protein
LDCRVKSGNDEITGLSQIDGSSFEEPTGPIRSGRPDDRLRDEAIKITAQTDSIASLSLAMTR